ncbi:MAG: hypothetical protein M1825_003096 [Sarcosagium campestre]|nr:MAG: hypothetical protein M1825_003096 [Sarcosagium campestre]
MATATSGIAIPSAVITDLPECTEVNEFCTVEDSIYGYIPGLGANIFFLVFFAICMIVQLVQGIRYKTWTFLIALGVGCLGEAIGYAGRILLHYNVYDGVGFNMQICCLIIAPAFIVAGVYLTLKHLVITFGAEHSRIQPRLYTWVFILCDLFSMILQGAGGGTAATADNDRTMQNVGNNLMITGIVWQVFTLLVFAGLCLEYILNVRRDRKSGASSELAEPVDPKKIKIFIGSIVIAFLTIFIRCVYRIAEMANGWQNPIMQNETDFIVLEGVMVVVAVLVLTIFHPGQYFPQMVQHNIAEKASKKSSGTSSPSDIEAGGTREKPQAKKSLFKFGSKK